MSATIDDPAIPRAGRARKPALGRQFSAQLISTGLANLGDGVLGTLAPLVALLATTRSCSGPDVGAVRVTLLYPDETENEPEVMMLTLLPVTVPPPQADPSAKLPATL